MATRKATQFTLTLFCWIFIAGFAVAKDSSGINLPTLPSYVLVSELVGVGKALTIEVRLGVKIAKLEFSDPVKGPGGIAYALAEGVPGCESCHIDAGERSLFFLAPCSDVVGGQDREYKESFARVEKAFPLFYCISRAGSGRLRTVDRNGITYLVRSPSLEIPNLEGVQAQEQNLLKLEPLLIYLKKFVTDDTPERREQQAEEVNIAKALFLYMLSQPETHFEARCIALENSETGDMADPPSDFLKSLNSLRPSFNRSPLVNASDCSLQMVGKSGGPVLKTSQGRAAVQLSVGRVRWVDESEVIVGASSYYGPTAAVISQYRMICHKGQWYVIKKETLAVS